MASRLPGMATHSSGDLMNASESTLITPSRSRMTSFLFVTMWAAFSAFSGSELRNIRDAVHLLMKRVQQRETVVAQRGVFGVHHHIVEEGVHAFAQRGERGERFRVVACGELALHARRYRFDLRVKILLRRFNEQFALHRCRRALLRLLQNVRDAL